ncbi:tape measure protein [Cognatishimia sp. MH4019]|uniref:tape measure protein n=1 Tax=Cognatishimia sp. MH4019 TaxID=2854030 RepID=UPI001CD71B89|nr:tape measure protein [Cognatishimia sp. MH4019]
MTTERLVTEYTADTRNFRRGARVYDQTLARQERLTNDRLSRIDRRWERSTRSILNTRTALVGLTGYVGTQALRELRNYAEGWRDVERRLQSIGVVSAEGQKNLVQLALRTRSAVGGTATIVQRFQRSTGAGIEITTRRVETLQKLLAVQGATGSERTALGVQLGQALQSGVLSGDEFRTIRENAPIEFLDALASAAGVTRKQLKAVAEDQKLTTDVVLQALDGLAATADQKFGALAMSGDEAFNVLVTGLTAYVGGIDEALGATAAINGAMAGLGQIMAESSGGGADLARAIEIVGSVALAAAGGKGLGALQSSLQSGTAARRQDVAASQAQVAASRALVAQAGQELNAANARQRAANQELQFRLAAGRAHKTARRSAAAADRAQERAALALAGAHARATAAKNGLVAAQNRLNMAYRAGIALGRTMRGVMAFFGGPVGLAITAIGALALGMASARTSTERLESSIGDLNTTMGRLEGVNDTILSDLEQLKLSQDRLSTAVQEGGEIAVNAARKEVLAINDRIRANALLRQELAIQARLRLNDLEKQLEAAERGQLENLRQAYAQATGDLELGAIDATYEQLEQFRKQLVAAADAIIKAGGSTSDLTDEMRLAMSSTAELAAEVEAARQKSEALSAEGEQIEMSLNGAADAAAALGQTDVSSEISRAADEAGRLWSNLASALNISPAVSARRVQAGIADGSIPPQAAADLPKTEADRAMDRVLQTRRQVAAAAAKEAARPKSRSDGSRARSEAKEARDAERDLSAARELLVENGQKALYIEQELNAERQRLLELLPALIDMGLSRADAEAVINSELQRTEERLGRVKTASEEAAEAFARGIMSDIRQAENLGDAIGRIGDRLLDLALDPVFDMLTQQFATMLTGGGAGGGLLGSFASALFPVTASANGNAFNGSGVVPFARGGVVDKPTFFNFAGKRKGVMGEAGPEAILPLSRGKNGKLGVVAELPTTPAMPAGAMQANSTFSWTGDMVIQSNSDQPQDVGQEVTDQMRAMFVQMFSKQLGDAMRGGGILNSTYQKKAGA